MKRTTLLLGAALALVLFSTPALASPIFGSLGNFDVINDTGQVTRGFEIELEGVNPADVVYTFGNPYIRYGDPVKVATPTGTIVRYASPFGAGGWAVGTPAQDPLNPIVTGGHQLFYQGDPNYINLPGDHFGVALNGNPTNTIYRWLLGDASGNLSPAGTNVKIPAPVWNVQPAPNPAAPPAVQAVVPALPKEHPEDLFGEAIWVKVFVTESPNPAELHHLLVGDPAVPDGSDPAEVETEWQLLQDGKNGVGEVDSGLKELAAGAESVTRRYEFYKYTGPYNAEGEALIENPANDPTAVGEFLGGQNAALNLAGFVVPEPGTLTLLGIGLASMAGYGWRRRRVVAA
ncbi:MAG: PEP-CTERM sorting domain-containing protein [Pirellulales bacterium]